MDHISHSQEKVFNSCNLKWFMDKVKKIRKPDSASAILGTKFHSMMEDWVIGKDIKKHFKENPTLKRIFTNNQDWFKKMAQKKKIKVEEEFNIPLACGIKYNGKIDLSENDGEEISDYKSMSSYNYALDKTNLGDDDQLNGYGYAKNKSLKKDVVKKIRHYQINTRDYSIREVEAPFNKDKGIAYFHKLNSTAINMIAMEKQDIKYVPKNRKHCDAFGGCPYRPYCDGKVKLPELKKMLMPDGQALADSSTAEEKIEELKKELGGKSMAFAEKLKKQRGDQDEQATKFKKTAAKKAVEPDDEDDTDTEEEEEELPKKAKSVFGKLKTKVEEEPEEEEEIEEEEEEEPVKKSKFSFGKKKKEVEPEEEEETEEEEEEEPVKKSKSPLLKKMSAFGNKKLAEQEVEEEEEEVDEVIEETPKKGKKAKSINTMQTVVFVNCMPLAKTFDFVQPTICLHKKFIEPILEELKIEHMQLAKYGEASKSLFAMADDIRNELKSKNFVFIDTKRIVDSTVLEILCDDVKDNFLIVRSIY